MTYLRNFPTSESENQALIGWLWLNSLLLFKYYDQHIIGAKSCQEFKRHARGPSTQWVLHAIEELGYMYPEVLLWGKGKDSILSFIWRNKIETMPKAPIASISDRPDSWTHRMQPGTNSGARKVPLDCFVKSPAASQGRQALAPCSAGAYVPLTPNFLEKLSAPKEISENFWGRKRRRVFRRSTSELEQMQANPE